MFIVIKQCSYPQYRTKHCARIPNWGFLQLGQRLPKMFASLLGSVLTILAGMLATKAPQHSRGRFSVLFIALALYSFLSTATLSSSEHYNGIWAIAVIFYTVYLLCYLHLTDNELSTNTWAEVWFIQPNLRCSGTQKNVTRVRPTGQSISRKNFFMRRQCSLFALYAVMCVYYDLVDLPGFLQMQPQDFSPSKQVFFRRLRATEDPVTVRDVIIWTVFETVGCEWVALTSIRTFFAIVFVAFGVVEPEDWPQLFGSISEAYTFRNYWTKFWHLLFYRTGSACADWITRNVLRVRQRNQLSRYMNNFLVFFLSGVMHLFARPVISGGLPGDWTVPVWFSGQSVLFLLEDEIIAKYQSLIGNRYRVLGQLAGYFWVFGFLFWSIPKINYAPLYKPEDV